MRPSLETIAAAEATMIMAGDIDATVTVAATRRNAAGAELKGAPGRAVEARLRTRGWAGP